MEENEYFQEMSNLFIGFLLFVIMQVTILKKIKSIIYVFKQFRNL